MLRRFVTIYIFWELITSPNESETFWMQEIFPTRLTPHPSPRPFTPRNFYPRTFYPPRVKFRRVKSSGSKRSGRGEWKKVLAEKCLRLKSYTPICTLSTWWKWQRRGLNTILNIIVCDITTDRLSTGVIIVHKLDRGITLVKTWYSNPKWFLEEPKAVSGNKFLSTIFYQIDDANKSVSNKNGLLVCSYVTKPKSGKQNQVVLLNITYPLKGTMDDNVRRPVLLKLYHFTKGGTDVIDQRLTR